MQHRTNSSTDKPPLENPEIRQAAIVHTVALISAAVPLRCIVLARTLVLALSLLGSTAHAAIHCVRPGATGANTGADWANAYSTLPSSLIRGDTYYLADGAYSWYLFDDNASGTNAIYIKKATTEDHGIAVGWSASYGDGIAEFGQWIFSGAPSGHSGYYNINGYSSAVTGNYGIKVKVGDYIKALNWYGDQTAPYCEFLYIEIAGPAGTGDYDFVKGRAPIDNSGSYGIFQSAWTGSGQADLSHTLVSHCYIHGFSTLILTDSGSDYFTLEYTDMADVRNANLSGLGNIDHPNLWWLGNLYSTVRYNKFHNYSSEGIFFGGSPMPRAHGGDRIYGNVFYDGCPPYASRGIEFRGSETGPASYTDIKIYNNTFYGLGMSAIRVMAGSATSGVEFKNNLLGDVGISIENGGAGITQSDNMSCDTSVFVNYTSRDFRIVPSSGPTYPRDKGGALASAYNTDPLGAIRGADGAWDIGAYEYGVVTNPVIQVSPTQLAFGPVAAGASATNVFTVRNVGAGMLSGTASVPTSCTNYLRIVSGATYSLGAGQSQQVTVRYSPTMNGTDTGNITCSGGGGTQVSMAGSLMAVMPGLSFPSSAGAIRAPFTTSGGYVSQTVDVPDVNSGGQAVYAFNVTNGGSYTVSASVNAPNSASDSFWVNIDALPTDPSMVWDISPSTVGFQTRTVSWRGSGGATNAQYDPQVFNLNPGVHQLIIVGREADVQLGQITITVYGTRPSPPSPPQNLHIAVVQ